MKSLKSLFATLSCTALIVGIGLPGISETLKDIHTQPQSIGIGNKEYGNKQNASSMAGSWKSSVRDNEYKHLRPTEIYLDVKSDGTTTYAFREINQNKFVSPHNTTYKYSNGIWVQKLPSGSTTISSIKWISDNEFIQTLLQDTLNSERNGLQRRYIRQQESVATIVHQRAQQAAASAAASQQKYRKLQGARDSFNDVNNSWGAFYDAF